MGAIRTGSRTVKLAGLAVAGALALAGLNAAPAMAASSTVVVKGHVYSPTQKGVRNVLVTVYYRIPSVGQYLSKQTRTSSTGRYEVKVPRSFDSYKLKVTDPGDNDRDTADGQWAPTLLPTFKSDASTILKNATVHHGAKLSGRIYDRNGKPVGAGLEVMAFGDQQIGTNRTYTRSDGSYHFTNLRFGDTRVLAYSPSTNSSPRYYQRTNSSGTTTADAATNLYLQYGKSTTGASIYFPTVSKITGRVLVNGQEPFGEGSDYVTTTLYRADGSTADVYQTKPEFKFRDLPAGTYYLGFTGAEVAPEFYADKATLATATPITVKSGGAVSGLVAHLDSPPTT